MKYIKITCLIALLITVSGCKKWLDVNTDPATPQVAKAEFYLSPILFQMANNTATDNRVIFKYTQNMLSQDIIDASLNWEKHGYQSGNDLGGSMWRMTYVNLGLNLESMIADAEANNKWTYAGIGYAIKAWAFQILTDAHGPIILDQAFDPERLSFNYQDQPEVYQRVREWSQKALQCFAKTDGASYAGVLAGPSGDQMYKGDREKWKKFIYANLALQYVHLVNKPQFKTQYADSVVKYTDLSFASTADDATIAFNGVTSADANPLGPLFNLLGTTSTTTGTYGRVSQPIVDLLTGGVRGTPAVNPTSSTDPRLSRMINPMVTPLVPATNGVYRGVVVTQGDVAAIKTIPNVLGAVAAPFPGKYIFSDKARYPIMTYSQLQFAKSEALFQKGDMSGAYTAYLNGIRGHMAFINTYGLQPVGAAAISAAEITAYLATSEVAQTAGDLTLADIMQQKYISQWGWAGMEQWSDMRKYHYDPLIFKTFKQLEESQFFINNGGKKYAYRLRPRYNSEYIWNRNELLKWGGLATNYHTMETWFTLPNN